MKNLAIFIVLITLFSMVMMSLVSNILILNRVRLLEQQIEAIELVDVTQNNKIVGYIIVKEFRIKEKE